MKNNEIYTFITDVNRLYVTNIDTNVTIPLTLGVTKLGVKMTPDRQRAVIWDKSNAELYVHQLNTSFTQLFFYDGSKTGGADSP